MRSQAQGTQEGNGPPCPAANDRPAECTLVGRFCSRPIAHGRRFRVFNVLDDVTKECLAAVAYTSTSGRRIARELTLVIARRGKPDLIVSDHGKEFTSNAMLAWSEETGIAWHFIAPSKRMQNGIF